MIIPGDEHGPGRGGAKASRQSGLSFASIVPGLIVALGLGLISVAGLRQRWAPLVNGAPLVLLSLPWATLLVCRLRPADLGFVRRRAIADFGWGMLAGALWRVASLGFNLWWGSPAPRLGAGPADWLGGLVWVPLIEETFYRGYLGRGLRGRLGRSWAIVVQASLFALQPVHWSQGMPHLLSIFAFGILAGILVERSGSLWPAWGAHAFASLLPLLLAGLAGG